MASARWNSCDPKGQCTKSAGNVAGTLIIPLRQSAAVSVQVELYIIVGTPLMQIVVDGPLITKGSTAWGKIEPYRTSQEAVRSAVAKHPDREQLKDWLETRTKLELTAEFKLCVQRANMSDMDNLLNALFNPLVEGACGCRPVGKSIPQNKDALFWRVHASKIADNDERTVLLIRPLEASDA